MIEYCASLWEFHFNRLLILTFKINISSLLKMFSRLKKFFFPHEELAPQLEFGRNLLVSPNLESVIPSQAHHSLAQKLSGSDNYIRKIQHADRYNEICICQKFSSEGVNGDVPLYVDTFTKCNPELLSYLPVMEYLVSYILKQETGKYSFCVLEPNGLNRYSCIAVEMDQDQKTGRYEQYGEIIYRQV